MYIDLLRNLFMAPVGSPYVLGGTPVLIQPYRDCLGGRDTLVIDTINLLRMWKWA